MHYTHLICIAAEDAEDAAIRAEQFLDDSASPDLYDYFSIEKFIFDGHAPIAALSVDNERATAMSILNTVAGWQQQAMRNFLDGSDLAVLAGSASIPLKQAAEDFRVRMLGFELRGVGNLLSGFYTSYSHFYDVEECTANPYVRLRILQENPAETGLWLVQADLHN